MRKKKMKNELNIGMEGIFDWTNCIDNLEKY